MVTCPRGVQPGQRVTFQLPNTEKPQGAAPNHQMFEVVVPEGVTPGKSFALMANGQKVMVTCPPNVRPGQKIRFQLPIQLSQDELKAITVSYDKDGWSRCLGQDLKFYWIYQKSTNSDTEQHTKATLIPFNAEETAFVRKLTTIGKNTELEFTDAVNYACDTSVSGTTVNYQELNQIGNLDFQAKCTWLKTQFDAIRTKWEDGHIKIRIRRSNLLQDAVDAFESIEKEDMKKIFRFEFIGEQALDAGGVAREFYGLVCEQLFNADFGMWASSTVNQMCMQINPNSGIANEFHLRYFHLAGRILGKGLMDSHITPVHLVQPMYKHLMAWPMCMKDIELLDDQIYRNLTSLLDLDDVSMLCLEFNTTEDQLGSPVTVELCPNGNERGVDNSNVREYLICQLKYRLLNRIKPQLTEFLTGKALPFILSIIMIVALLFTLIDVR